MRLHPECGPCMLNRALMFCEKEDEETKYRVFREICAMFSGKFASGMSTTEAADMRNRLIEEITRDKDPMKDLKEESVAAAKKAYPGISEYVSGIKDDKQRFMAALRAALAGNTVEFGARDHKLDLSKLEEEILSVLKCGLAVDDTERIYEKAKAAKNILYVTDNAGELVFDRIFIAELARYANVTVAPLSKPVQDDAWTKDAEDLGIDKEYPLLPRSDSIGVWFERCAKEFVEAWEQADLIIAKGMGCYETLMDRPDKTRGKVAILMKAKCKPVASEVGAPVGSHVAKLL